MAIQQGTEQPPGGPPALPLFGTEPRPVRNVVSNWGAFVFSAAVNFAISPFIVHTLGDTVYGAWVLVGAMIGYLGLLDLGVRGAVTRYVARMHAANDHADARRITSAAISLFAVSGVGAILLATGLAFFIDDIFKLPPDLVLTARVVLMIGGVNVAISLVFGVFGGVVAAMQRFDLSSAVDVGVTALRAAAMVLALHNGMGLIALSLIQLGDAALRGGAHLWLARKLYPLLRFEFGTWGMVDLRRIFAFSVYSTFLHVAGMLTLQTDSMVIGAMLPVGMITAYAIAANLTGYARVLSSGVSQTLTPQASALEGRGDSEGVGRLALSSSRITTLVMLPIVITFLLRGETFIGLWMGPEYAEPAGAVLRILAITLYVANPRNIAASILMGLGRHRGLVAPFFTEALVNLGLSILLIGPLGIAGVAWGTAIPSIFMSMMFVPWYMRKVLKVPVLALWREAWLKPTIAMVPFALATAAVERWWDPNGVFGFFGQVGTVLPAAVLGALYLGLTAAERQRYLALPTRG